MNGYNRSWRPIPDKLLQKLLFLELLETATNPTPCAWRIGTRLLRHRALLVLNSTWFE